MGEHLGCMQKVSGLIPALTGQRKNSSWLTVNVNSTELAGPIIWLSIGQLPKKGDGNSSATFCICQQFLRHSAPQNKVFSYSIPPWYCQKYYNYMARISGCNAWVGERQGCAVGYSKGIKKGLIINLFFGLVAVQAKALSKGRGQLLAPLPLPPAISNGYQQDFQKCALWCGGYIFIVPGYNSRRQKYIGFSLQEISKSHCQISNSL